ncbi:TetR/AcrR family transcriptional regulator [Methylomonas sp. UP202]|uniref:TetR/AcrR family transcriptional regulator n=1 Tax=Methylomonas sp. UP202 TaxID=3040943 RepID=UPI002479BA75|nr:TetR/AcrR family transcriptional regulator [Methylomonas sp. UP202]WGS83882.1 TetR/AcrR family transcriptional regulator [Methylomonas sp. UP202]
MRKKSPERRQTILDAAKITFEKLGFERATMSDIATLAGVSKATLYSYFSAKNELFLELVESSADHHKGMLQKICEGESPYVYNDELRLTVALLQPSEDIATTLKAVGERVLSTFFTPQKLAVRRMIIAASGSGEIGKLFFERGPALGMKYLEDYFAAAIEAGRLRSADPRIAAVHFRGLLESEVYEPWLLNILHELPPDLIHDVVARAVEVFMRAYGPEGS